MSRPGHPTSLTVARCIETLRNALFTEYGVDYAFTVLGKGYLLAASGRSVEHCHDDDCRDCNGIVEAVTSGPERVEPAPSYPAWLPEAVLSMEHHHSPAVRSYGDSLRKRMGGK